jgi:hypothetical protein
MSEVAYFDTPERSEREQLLCHLLNNAEEIPYLRAPAGAGKTRFTHRAAVRLEPDYQVVWLLVGAALPLRDQLYYELGLDAASAWPSGVLEAAGDRPLLLVVDDADGLQPAELGDLLDLHQAGVKLLLVGTGGLGNTRGDWDLQFVDLPSFTQEQSLAFIQAQGQLRPGAIDENTAIRLHRAAGGLPGPLLDAMGDLPGPGVRPGALAGLRLSWPLLAVGGLLVILLVLALVFQTTINRWFEPGGKAAAPSVAAVQETRDTRPVDAEPPVFKSRIAPRPLPSVDAHPAAAPVKAPVTPAGPGARDVAAKMSSPGPVRKVNAAQPDETGDNAPDPVLDAVIDAAISAAEQPAPKPQDGKPGDSLSRVGPDGSPKSGAEQARNTPPATGKAAGPAARTSAANKAVGVVKRPGSAGADTAAAPKAAPAAGDGGGRTARVSAKAAPRTRIVSKTRSRAASAPAARTGLAWLRAQPGRRYTLQLVGARDRGAVNKFIKKHHIHPPYAVFVRDLSGKPWYSLVAGSYPDHAAAVAARARRFKGLSGAWPRTFASIRQQLKP